MKMTVWSLTVDADDLTTAVHGTEKDCYDDLRRNFGEDFADLNDGELLSELTEHHGLVICLQPHLIDVPTT